VLTAIGTEDIGDGLAAISCRGNLLDVASHAKVGAWDDKVVAEHAAGVMAAVGAVADGLRVC
jgi:hypothetical protein